MDQPNEFGAMMVSSDHDLLEYRKMAADVIKELGYYPNQTEFPLGPDTIRRSVDLVRTSVAYIVIIGWTYSRVIGDTEQNPGALSLTELEFDEAVRRHKPIVALMMRKERAGRRAFSDERSDRDRIIAFRDRVKQSQVVYEFDDPEEFASIASTAIDDLARHLQLLKNSSPEPVAERSTPPPEVHPDPRSKQEPEPPKPTAPAKLTTAPFYSDHAARRDLLNRKAVAETVATMIENVWEDDARAKDVDRTFMVHLHGRWGAGKTSILNFLREALRTQTPKARAKTNDKAEEKPREETDGGPPWVIIDYNAWRNQALGPAWWTMMETVYREARDQLGGWFSKAGLRLILRDRWWRLRSSYAPYALAALLAVCFGLLLVWIWHASLFDQTKPWFVDGFKLVGSILGLIVTVFAFGHNYPIGSARTARSYLELSRDPLSPLITRYGDLVRDIDRPVAVFIDDLDRCNAEFVVELLQTIQTLFRHAKVLYVVAADRDWVCSSYQQMYKTFNDSIGEPGKSLGHLFVEKVFQLSVEVPRLSDDERNRYWEELIWSKPPSESESQKQRIADATHQLRTADTEAKVFEVVNRYRDDPGVAGVVGAQAFKQMQSAPLEQERQHFLSSYAHLIEPNPRAMKRLLNAYGFRRGFDIQSRRPSDPDALVRWTILENRWPILADYLENRSSGTDIVKALTKDAEVLKVADGLTWDKLRPVASAPDQPPTPEITPGAATKVKKH